MARDSIGPFEFDILATLLAHPNGAYGITIRDRIKQRTDREPSIGAVYTALERLERKGFISSCWGKPTEERGGRRKRLYKIEASGELAARRFESRFVAPQDRFASSVFGWS